MGIFNKTKGWVLGEDWPEGLISESMLCEAQGLNVGPSDTGRSELQAVNGVRRLGSPLSASRRGRIVKETNQEASH